MCCSNGKVNIERLQEPPEPLKSLLGTDTSESKDFHANIRKYNAAFQMTSFGTTGVHCMRTGFMLTFNIQGQAYHQIGSLLPLSGDEARFLQIYFVGDEEEQTRIRRSHQPGIKPHTVTSLQRMLHDSNKYVKTLKSTTKCLRKNTELKSVQTRRREENTNDGAMLQCQMTSELLLWGKK